MDEPEGRVITVRALISKLRETEPGLLTVSFLFVFHGVFYKFCCLFAFALYVGAKESKEEGDSDAPAPVLEIVSKFAILSGLLCFTQKCD